ncbi:MAG: type I secretion C-terminal target domain-containing protein [Proteobacteria bacterium]|nr:type I secretion C-terminal target domain-containing protein [Pseudomonadota bacterium]
MDTIKDFNKYKDTLDIRDLLTNYDPMTDMLEDFVKVDRSRGKTTISVDMDGQGTDASFTSLAIIQGSRVDLQDFVNGGALLTA